MLDSLANLHAQCFPHRPWSADEFLDLKKSGCEIIASDNGFIVWRVVDDTAEIYSIGVAPAARRTGIAAAMLGIMEQEVRNAGVTRIILEVRENNTAARALYENNGYIIDGRRPKYYEGTTDAILMSKNLQ